MSHVFTWSVSINQMPFTSRVVPADMSEVVNTPLPTPSGPEDFITLTLCFVIDAMLCLLITTCLRSPASPPQGSVSLSSALLSAGKAVNDIFGALGALFPNNPMNIVALML